MKSHYRAERHARTKEAKAILARMKEKHPGAFPSPPRPLKIGIREDLIAAGWTTDETNLALGFYINSEPYLRSTYAEGAFRIDLRGLPVEPVPDFQAAWARNRIVMRPYEEAMWGGR